MTQGWLGVWYMNGSNFIGSSYLTPNQISDSNWRIVGAGDFNGDAKPDLIWQHGAGLAAALVDERRHDDQCRSS